LSGFHEPQGVAFISDYNKLFVANAKGGACDILDGSSLKPIKSVKFSDDADNIRYDAKAHAVYVGYGSGALGIIDATNGEQLGAIKLTAHPESFQLEQNGSRIFVNTPDAGSIAVLDREKKAKVVDWSFPKAKANYPMALDEKHHRLYVGFRKPATLAVFDTESGKLVTEVQIPGDADDIFYDASRQRIYVSGGEGFIGIIQQQDANGYIAAKKIPGATGARTSLFVPELDRLYLAVPHRGSQNAEIRVFEATP
jgi:DNA-binding beta-propeller fold protein YncE